MAKHAYLIVANSNLLVLRTCLRMIDDARNDIYLLLDKKAGIREDIIESLKGEVILSKMIVSNSLSINWGGYSQIEAVLVLLKSALCLALNIGICISFRVQIFRLRLRMRYIITLTTVEASNS